MWHRTRPKSEDCKFFYSHIPCGMWQGGKYNGGYWCCFSTHTSRVGCDLCGLWVLMCQRNFLLTHPVWDVTPSTYTGAGIQSFFLLTHPVWDVTYAGESLHFYHKFSTHTSRVGCDFLLLLIRTLLTFSTHTSRVGCDYFSACFLLLLPYFSTHTSRVGCDSAYKAFLLLLFFSTHTSRVGCDWFVWFSVRLQRLFYSHIPCGMWLYFGVYRGAKRFSFSTHTSRVGCD